MLSVAVSLHLALLHFSRPELSFLLYLPHPFQHLRRIDVSCDSHFLVPLITYNPINSLQAAQLSPQFPFAYVAAHGYHQFDGRNHVACVRSLDFFMWVVPHNPGGFTFTIEQLTQRHHFAVVNLLPLSNNQKTKTREALKSICTQAQVPTFF